MASKRSAGAMRGLVNVLGYISVPDGYGGEKLEWATVATVAANFRPLVGSEAVMASRLASKQPFVVTIRSSIATRVITAAYKLQDARNPARTFDIKAVSDPDGKGAWIEILAEEIVT